MLLSQEPRQILSQLFVQFVILPHVAVGHASSQPQRLCRTALCDSHKGQLQWVEQLCSRGIVEVYPGAALHLNYACIVGGVVPDCTVIVAISGGAVVTLSFKLFWLYPGETFDLFLAGKLVIAEEGRVDIVYDMRCFLSRRKGVIGLAMRLIVVTHSSTALQQSQQRNEVFGDRKTIFLRIFNHHLLCLFESDDFLPPLEVVQYGGDVGLLVCGILVHQQYQLHHHTTLTLVGVALQVEGR